MEQDTQHLEELKAVVRPFAEEHNFRWEVDTYYDVPVASLFWRAARGRMQMNVNLAGDVFEVHLFRIDRAAAFSDTINGIPIVSWLGGLVPHGKKELIGSLAANLGNIESDLPIALSKCMEIAGSRE